MNDFSEWVQRELDARSWTRAELARRADISESMLSFIFSGQRQAGQDVCIGIARAFGIPRKTVFRAAGILEPAASEAEKFEDEIDDWREILKHLTPDEKAELREIGWLKLSRREAANRIQKGKKIPDVHNP